MKSAAQTSIEIENCSIEDMWPRLHDVNMLASCSSAIDDVAEVEPGNAWTAYFTRRVGRFGISVPLRIDMVSDVAGEAITIRGQGLDRKMGSRLSFDAEMRVAEPNAEGTSRLALTVEYELTGQVASMGSAVVRKHAEELVSEFGENLARALGGS